METKNVRVMPRVEELYRNTIREQLKNELGYDIDREEIINIIDHKIKELFNHEGPEVRRVAAVFVTQNGKKNTALLGMITPWDIMKISK